ncbi:MAG: hypothetical protein HY749_10200 [Gammaproteobacteria bacterium]|nr:hypothetical protein [Gammaproteobacteria bacterium]
MKRIPRRQYTDEFKAQAVTLAESVGPSLDATTMGIDGNEIKLAPGMAVSAEVKMGTRKVIEFLLSPLLRYQQESGRER